jgi:DNA-binding NarL/FixJ family response regulator
VLHAAARLAADRGYATSEAWLLHDVLRLGDAASVVDRLNGLAQTCEGEFVAVYAAHATASVSGKGAALVDVVDRFEAIGAMVLAAEVANQAAQSFQRAGDRRSAAALGLRFTTLVAACEGARTPAMAARVMVVPLTSRERDIATLAARGHSSKDIAERLYVSVRTVNNHLQSVYAKLGVSGRHELASTLAETSDDG